MASSINASNPVNNSPSLSSIRANFSAAKNEIETLQAFVNSPDIGNVIDGTTDYNGTPTVTAGGAGVLTGTYTYAITFVTSSGETACWPGTPNSITVSSQSINLSNIAVSSDPAVTGRRVYRSDGSSVDVKAFKLVAQINNNTSTTYSDNTPDASLGTDAPWISSTRGYINLDGQQIAAFGNGQAVAVGVGAMATRRGYACTAVGYNSLNAITSGRRNSAFGIYSLPSLTSGFENSAFGVHTGQYVLTQRGNALHGYSAGFNIGAGIGSGNYNTAIGAYALRGTTSGIGDSNTAVGYYALGNMTPAWNCIGIGPYAGQFANANYQVFIDAGGTSRANLSAQQDVGLIYGKCATASKDQDLRLNSITRIGGSESNAIVSNLQTASAALKGYRGWVSDATVPYTSVNVGSTVIGGGSNSVPVFCTGTNWVIG